MAVLSFLCRVDGLLPDSGSVGVTAIDKRPIEGSFHVRQLGLHGDVQADRKHHGGYSKALYAYADEDAREWARILGREITPGFFGENLRTSGLDVSGAVIGEQWRIGDEVVVEVTCPRMPCATFQRRMGERQWVRRFTEQGLPGAYLRVVRTGSIAAGDEITVVSRPTHAVTIAQWFTRATEAAADALECSEAAGEFELAPEMRVGIEQLRKQHAARTA